MHFIKINFSLQNLYLMKRYFESLLATNQDGYVKFVFTMYVKKSKISHYPDWLLEMSNSSIERTPNLIQTKWEAITLPLINRSICSTTAYLQLEPNFECIQTYHIRVHMDLLIRERFIDNRFWSSKSREIPPATVCWKITKSSLPSNSQTTGWALNCSGNFCMTIHQFVSK